MRRTLFLLLLLLCLVPRLTLAQQALTFTVTPTFTDVKIAAGDSWVGSIKLTNPNPFELIVFLEPQHVEAADEAGQSLLIPLPEAAEALGDQMLGSWIELSESSVIMARESSVEISYAIRVPQEAPPGGHTAAVVATASVQNSPSSESEASTQTALTSLLFVTVPGETQEQGVIQMLDAQGRLHFDEPVTFSITFENTGNTYLRPRGFMTVFSAFGKELTSLPVNQDTDLGYVLPQSSRTFTVVWDKTFGLFDLGMYRADATLTFGEKEKQNVTGTTTFWIVPAKLLLLIAGALLLGVVLLRRFIHRSIRTELEKHVKL